MVQNAFAMQKKYSKNLKKIIPVVASTYELNETAFAPPEGITELIDITNELMPDGIKAGEVEKITPMLKELGDNVKPKDIAKAIIKLFTKNKN